MSTVGGFDLSGMDEEERKRAERIIRNPFLSDTQKQQLLNTNVPNFTDDEQSRIDAELERLKGEYGNSAFFKFKTYRTADGRIAIETRGSTWDPIRTTYIEPEGPDDPFLWAVSLDRIPSELRKVPIYPWGRAKPNGMTAANAIDSMRLVQVVVNLNAKSPVEIPITDNDDLPALDPAIPPLVEMRHVNSSEASPLPANDAVDDPTLQFTPGRWWTDSRSNFPIFQEISSFSFRWALRLVRSPVPHWVIRVSYDTTNTPFDPADPQHFGVLFHLLGTGGGSHTGSAGIQKEVGTTYTHGHYSLKLNWHVDGNVESGDVINGTLAEINRPKLMVVAGDTANYDPFNPSDQTTGNLYFRTPTAKSTDTAVFTSTDPPMVTCFKENDVSNPTISTETGWRAATLGGQDAKAFVGLADPPFHGPNLRRHAFVSELDWDSVFGEWKLLVLARQEIPLSQQNFYLFAVGY